MIYIDDEGNCRLTGAGAEWKTDAETMAAFDSLRETEIPIEQARFLADLHEDNGNLIDTIAISVETFEQVTGQKAKSNQWYVDYDERMNKQKGCAFCFCLQNAGEQCCRNCGAPIQRF
jgi:hypothetical protein